MMIRQWMDESIQNHPECRRSIDAGHPTQLLDLNMADKNVRLILNDDTAVREYASLSYSWGNCQSVTLQQTNYEEFMNVIVLEKLPRTIREAVAVCRRLNINYLWVDALCIIQGDSNDFTKEISRMGSIYAGSLLNIGAADSTDRESGLFRDRLSPLYEESCLVWEDEEIAVHLDPRIGQWPCPHLNPMCGSLKLRAWVLQELMLSPRTVHFDKWEIVWECRYLRK